MSCNTGLNHVWTLTLETIGDDRGSELRYLRTGLCFEEYPRHQPSRIDAFPLIECDFQFQPASFDVNVSILNRWQSMMIGGTIHHWARGQELSGEGFFKQFHCSINMFQGVCEFWVSFVLRTPPAPTRSLEILRCCDETHSVLNEKENRVIGRQVGFFFAIKAVTNLSPRLFVDLPFRREKPAHP